MRVGARLGVYLTRRCKEGGDDEGLVPCNAKLLDFPPFTLRRWLERCNGGSSVCNGPGHDLSHTHRAVAP